MKTFTFTFFTFLLMAGSLSAQNFKDKAFQGFGYHFGFSALPAFESEDEFRGYDQFIHLVMGINYSLRYNLYELNDNHSVGISVLPALGIDFGRNNDEDIIGLGGFNLPLELSYNIGAGATYNSSANHGVAFKTGLDLNINPLLPFTEYDGLDKDFKKFYAGFHTGLAIRFWYKSSSLNELFIRYTFLKHKVEIDPDDDILNPILIRVGFRSFLGY